MFLHTAYQSQGEKVMRGNTLGYGSETMEVIITVRSDIALHFGNWIYREVSTLILSLHIYSLKVGNSEDDYPESKLIVIGSHPRFHFGSMSVPSIWLTSLLKSYPKTVKHDSANQQAKGCFTRKDQFLTPSRTVT